MGTGLLRNYVTWKGNSHVGFQVPTEVVMKSTIFWDITPCSQLKVNRRFGGPLLATCFHAGFLLGLFSTLKMEAICSSETSVDFQRTTRRYIPEDSTLQTQSYLINKLIHVILHELLGTLFS
jgi:hypothetical protein